MFSIAHSPTPERRWELIAWNCNPATTIFHKTPSSYNTSQGTLRVSMLTSLLSLSGKVCNMGNISDLIKSKPLKMMQLQWRKHPTKRKQQGTFIVVKTAKANFLFYAAVAPVPVLSSLKRIRFPPFTRFRRRFDFRFFLLRWLRCPSRFLSEGRVEDNLSGTSGPDICVVPPVLVW